MSLYKRSKVYWSAVYVDGVRHVRSLETTNRRQAEMREQAIKDELSARQLPASRASSRDDLQRTLRPLPGRGRCETAPPRPRQALPAVLRGYAYRPDHENDAIRYRKYRHEEASRYEKS